jgi:hypothetical protein
MHHIPARVIARRRAPRDRRVARERRETPSAAREIPLAARRGAAIHRACARAIVVESPSTSHAPRVLL